MSASTTAAAAAAPPPPPDVRALALKMEANAAYAAGDVARALDTYNKALALAPDSAVLRTNKAAALVRLSRAAEEAGDAAGAKARALTAEEEATLALALDPGHALKALRRRAAARVALRDHRLALEDLHAALEAVPPGDDAAATRASLAAEIEAVKAGANHFTYRDALTGAVLAEITELETDRLALGAREELSVHTKTAYRRAAELTAAATAAAKALRAQALTVYSAWAEEAAKAEAAAAAKKARAEAAAAKASPASAATADDARHPGDELHAAPTKAPAAAPPPAPPAADARAAAVSAGMAAVGADPADPAALTARAAAFRAVAEHDAALADLETARSLARSTGGGTEAGLAAAMDAAIREVRAARDKAAPMEGVAEGEEEDGRE